MSEPTVLDALIVGAGFSGLYQLHLLRKLGFKVKAVEEAKQIGGVWHWNKYPGARVDSGSPDYDVAIPEVFKDWTWSERYPGREELVKYFAHIDKVLDLTKDIFLNTRMLAATYNEEKKNWFIHTTKGDFVAQFLLLCVGGVNRRYYPQYPGLSDYKGFCHHTSAWPEEGFDAKGKNVAVIGTGASGVQVIQELGPQSAKLDIYQRTPNLCLPMRQTPMDSASQQKNKEGFGAALQKRQEMFCGFSCDFVFKNAEDETPEARRALFEELWAQGGLRFWVAGYVDLLFSKFSNNVAYAFWAEKARERITDPKKKELLAPLKPPHAFGTKRPSLEQNYFEVCDRPNVEIVDIRSSPIDHFTETSIVTKDGVVHGPYDAVILATGFDMIIGGILDIEIKGKGGITIQEKWKDGVKTYLGMHSVGFPNLFIVYGPHCPTCFVSGPSIIESQVLWVAKCLEDLRAAGKKTIEAETQAEVQWTQHIHDTINTSLFPGTDSWYMGANIPGKKREILCYLGGLPVYNKKIQDVANNGYEGYILE